MRTIEVTIYVTDDGKEFRNEADARQHERRERIRKWVESTMSNSDYYLSMSNYADFADFLDAHFEPKSDSPLARLLAEP